MSSTVPLSISQAAPALVAVVYFAVTRRRSRLAARRGLCGAGCVLVGGWSSVAPRLDQWYYTEPQWYAYLLTIYAPLAAGYLLLAWAVVTDRPPPADADAEDQ